jgi:hypothetical protein
MDVEVEEGMNEEGQTLEIFKRGRDTRLYIHSQYWQQTAPRQEGYSIAAGWRVKYLHERAPGQKYTFNS